MLAEITGSDGVICIERQNSAMRAAHRACIGKQRVPPAFAAVILFAILAQGNARRYVSCNLSWSRLSAK